MQEPAHRSLAQKIQHIYLMKNMIYIEQRDILNSYT